MPKSTCIAESESFLCSVIHSYPVSGIYSDAVLESIQQNVITVNVESANWFTDYWILVTGWTNHGTSNRHLFGMFHPIEKAKHQVTTENNRFVPAKVSGTTMVDVDRPSAKPAKIFLQPALYVPACSTNYLLSIIQLMWRAFTFDFKLDGAIVSLGSVLIYESPLNNSVFVLRSSTFSASVSNASVVIADPTSSAPGSAREISDP